MRVLVMGRDSRPVDVNRRGAYPARLRRKTPVARPTILVLVHGLPVPIPQGAQRVFGVSGM